MFSLLKNKKDCADVYCVKLTELQAHRDAFIQKKMCNFSFKMEGKYISETLVLIYLIT